MKIITLFFILLTITSCNESEVSGNIWGSWKLKNITNTPPENFSDKTTFFKNDSATFEMLENGKVVSVVKARYSLDLKRKLLTTYYEDMSFTFDVLKLSTDELELRDTKTKKIDMYIRIK